jgi:hypothetical protein
MRSSVPTRRGTQRAHYIKQVSNGNKALAKLVLRHAAEDVTDRYAKDKAAAAGPSYSGCVAGGTRDFF